MRPYPGSWRVVSGTLLLALLVASPLAAEEKIPTRDDVADQYKWDLTLIYQDLETWEADFAKAKEDIAKLESLKDREWKLAGDPYEAFLLRDATRWLVDRLVVYAFQLHHLDMRAPEPAALKNRAADLENAYKQAVSWIEPKLQAVADDRIALWRTSNYFYLYLHWVDDVMRQKEHTLSQREEELLAMTGNVNSAPGDAYAALKDADIAWPSIKDEQGNPAELTPSRFNKFIRSADRRVRQDAFTNLMATFKQYENTFAATLAGAIQSDNYYAKARGFDSALESTLFPDNLPLSVYNNLVETINANLSLTHRWTALRKKATGLDELHVYDLYQPLAPGEDPSVPYDEAVTMVKEAVQPLGDEYNAVVDFLFRSRLIDVYETQGKRPGAYSWGSFQTPPYILLNYNGTLRDVSTLAHELGHAMHSYLTHRYQPPIYGKYSYYVAEVASTFNELLLRRQLYEKAQTREEKLRLLNEQIDDMRATVFRQMMFSEFEVEAHAMAARGEPLTAETFGKLYLDMFHKYWGPELVRDEWHAPYWARIPHFYRNHYVHRYASSFCAAAALLERVTQGGDEARDAYLGFLKAGSSKYPLEILADAGVDMTTTEPFEAAMRYFAHLMDEYEKLLESE